MVRVVRQLLLVVIKVLFFVDKVIVKQFFIFKNKVLVYIYILYLINSCELDKLLCRCFLNLKIRYMYLLK